MRDHPWHVSIRLANIFSILSSINIYPLLNTVLKNPTFYSRGYRKTHFLFVKPKHRRWMTVKWSNGYKRDVVMCLQRPVMVKSPSLLSLSGTTKRMSWSWWEILKSRRSPLPLTWTLTWNWRSTCPPQSMPYSAASTEQTSGNTRAKQLIIPYDIFMLL